MKLIVVTAPTFFVEEDKIITALFEEGLDILHLLRCRYLLLIRKISMLSISISMKNSYALWKKHKAIMLIIS